MILHDIIDLPFIYSELIDGQSAEVRIKVKSNPKPNDGTWNIGKTIVKIGNNSDDRTFFSNIKNGTTENEYCIVLLFTMRSGTKNYIIIPVTIPFEESMSLKLSSLFSRNGLLQKILFLEQLASAIELFSKTRTAAIVSIVGDI